MGSVGQASEHERPLSKRYGEVLGSSVEVGVGRARGHVGGFLVGNPGLDPKETPAVVDSLLSDSLPAVCEEVGLVAEVVVRAGDAAVNFKSTVLCNSQSRAEGVRDA